MNQRNQQQQPQSNFTPSWWDSITFKDVMLVVGGICTLMCHYFLMQMTIRESILEIRGDIKVLQVRINMIEATKKQTADNVYPLNTEAILPENKFKMR